MKTVYNSTKLAPHGRRRRTDATLAIGMERERRKTETMIPERERPPNADAPAGVVVVAQRAVYPRRSRRHWLSPADGAIRGGVGAEGGLEDVRRHRKGGRGHACRLSDAQVAELKQKAAEGQLQRVQDAVAWVKARYQVEDPWSGMYSLVPRAGLRKKVPRPFNPKASVEAHDAWKKGGLPLRQRRPGRAPQTWIGVTTCASDSVGRCAGCGRRAGERSSSREHGSAHGSP